MLTTPTQHHAAPVEPLGGTSFRNKCGRRGCGHVFEVAGPDDALKTISRLVNEHWHHCSGRSYRLPRTTSAEVTRSKLSIAGLVHGYNKAPMDAGGSEDENARGAWSSPSSSSSGSTTFSPVSVVSSSEAGTYFCTPSPPAPLTALSVLPTYIPLPPSRPRRIGASKKSARTEAQRRLELEADPWIVPGSVEPHAVVCRGCARRIKLDRRSLYYPGLWEKHRDRCESVVHEKDGDGDDALPVSLRAPLDLAISSPPSRTSYFRR